MSRQSRTKLVPPKTEPERNLGLQTLEESSVPEQKEEPVIAELDNEIECPRCNDAMELNSSFNTLAYFCENCGFLLKCI
ncbi:MAG: hypothetical protein WA941_16155 [Nitrososphaeraceae archaeon]